MIRDPQFWKRFSTAVHQDEQAKESQTSQNKNKNLKHSYVNPSSFSSSRGSPTPQTPALPPMAQLSPFRASFNNHNTYTSSEPPHPQQSPRRTKLKKSPSTKPLLRPILTPEPQTPLSPPRSFFRTPNTSTFNLSGRPSSRFHFVTTVTADGRCRDSWLVRQKKKERQRTWICCAFWGGLVLVAVAIVVTVLVLRAHGVL
ncbi:hypothetical protein BDW02DRAFT_181301 [Decorospora gaudefroyi]|uniref:Uncharacterized protein n=1 Tax=Decorospora gaudefroyi TaxID=184978 RepID=A0A6A5KU10_9PLEO|nr:hypothetical protein BDW02DRAFT_181301 [Decorospora gaudefroyi]